MKLIPVDSHQNLQKAYEIYLTNDSYFFKNNHTNLSIDDILEDRISTPPNTNFNQKKYALIEYENKIIGILDFIYHYPERNVIYINLLLLDKKFQGKFYGTKVVNQLIKTFETQDLKKIVLAILKENKLALNFWKKQNFLITDNSFTLLKKDNISDYYFMEKKL